MDKASTKPGYRALRKGRSSIPGQTYMVTTICRGRRDWFADWNCASTTSATLCEPRLWRNSHLQCWMLMPDHLHLLVELDATESLSSLIKRIKVVTARAANTANARKGCFWMSGFHDRALRNDEDVVTVARYIVANPLRAGICRSVGAYPYWDAIWLDSEPSQARS